MDANIDINTVIIIHRAWH